MSDGPSPPPRATGSLRGTVLAVCVALGLGALLYLPFLGASDLTYPDEPDVAAPAREMLERGDLLTPTHNGEGWIDYPPLVYWCAIASAHLLGGMDELSLRLPIALAALLLGALTGAFAARRFGGAVGVLAALALLTFPHFAYQATNVHPDMLFALLQSAGLLLYAVAEPWGRTTAWSARVVAFACFGLAILAKGPLGLLLPGLVLSVWHLSQRQWRRTLLLAPLALVALAVAFPWYALLAQAHGRAWVVGEFMAQNFARFETGVVRGHDRPWFYYFVRIWHCLGLWSLALPVALAWGLRRRLWADPLRRLLLLWAVLPFLFFTFAATKREVYLLPCYPAFALLVADALARARTLRSPWLAFRPESALRWLVRASTLCAAGAALLAAVGVFALPHLAWHVDGLHDIARPVVADLVPFALAVALLAPAVLVLLLRAVKRDDPALALGAIAALHAVPWVLLMSLALPRCMPLLSYEPHGRRLRQALTAGERLGFLAPGREALRRAAFLYYAECRLEILKDADGLAAYLAGAPGRLAVVDADLAQRLLATDARFSAAERWRFQVTSSRWIVLGGR